MNDLNASPANSAEEADPGRGYRDPSPSIRYGQSDTDYSERLLELEMENSRLHRLVAELLIKNQQLRKPD
ncbi:hypothetical protein [Tunturiibacter lichenicola]|uniref:hypothetical protein n=1 Tax=Tunturiibacter lichenicola TaxID=2051959 RepID=UPI0021B39207|nr:hypothetical protein [Edaphobacter lichenicola]